jgi:hypothetical protein
LGLRERKNAQTEVCATKTTRDLWQKPC